MSKQPLTSLIGTVLLKNDVDTAQEATAECFHSDTVGLAFSQRLEEEGIQIGIPAATSGHVWSILPSSWR